MKKFASYLMVLALSVLFSPVQAAQASTYADTREAADAYNKKDFAESLTRFQQLQVESPDDPKALFNLASAEYQTGKYPEAAKGFEEVLNRAKDAALKQKALYNLGNTAYRQGNLQASADYYRKSLEVNPSDADAKQNLEFVLKELEKQQQQKKDDKDKNENGKEKDKEQQQAGGKDKQKDGKSKQQASQDQQKDQQKGQNSSAQNAQDKEQNRPSGELKDTGSPGEQNKGEQAEAAKSGAKPDPKALAPDEAARLLNMLSDDQRAFIREQAKRAAPATRGTAEDW